MLFVDNPYNDNSLLIESIKKGDKKAYAFLVDIYYAKLFTYALNLSNSRSLAEDVAQNVFLNIWEKRKNLNAELPIKNFLYKSVYNNFVTQYRKKKAIGELEKKYVETINYLTEETDKEVFNKKVKIIRAEINNLPPKCKKVFLLSKREGLTNQEISEYLNISINTVENHITKAFSILKEKGKSISKHILFFLFSKHKLRN